MKTTMINLRRLTTNLFVDQKNRSMNYKGLSISQTLRIWAIKAVCKALMPENVWVSNYWGAYTQKAGVTFGKIDGRGVLQGVLEKDIFK